MQIAPHSLAIVLGPADSLAEEKPRTVQPSPPVPTQPRQLARHHIGYEIFADFKAENMQHFWNKKVTAAVAETFFLGWIDEQVLLIQGKEEHLEALREGWTRRALRPPSGFQIRCLGECCRPVGLRGPCLVSRYRRGGGGGAAEAVLRPGSQDPGEGSATLWERNRGTFGHLERGLRLSPRASGIARGASWRRRWRAPRGGAWSWPGRRRGSSGVCTGRGYECQLFHASRAWGVRARPRESTGNRDSGDTRSARPALQLRLRPCDILFQSGDLVGRVARLRWVGAVLSPAFPYKTKGTVFFKLVVQLPNSIV